MNKKTFVVHVAGTQQLVVIEDKKEMLDYVVLHGGALSPAGKIIASKLMDDDDSVFVSGNLHHLLIPGSIRMVTVYLSKTKG